MGGTNDECSKEATYREMVGWVLKYFILQFDQLQFKAPLLI